jgi:hypothetical protein
MERGLRVHCGLAEVKQAIILHRNGDMQINFPQSRRFRQKSRRIHGHFSPGKLPFEMLSTGWVELKQEQMGLPTHACRDRPILLPPA